MRTRTVRELMLTLDNYAVVSTDATIADAVRTLKNVERRLLPDRQPARAVLVVDPQGAVVGQLGISPLSIRS